MKKETLYVILGIATVGLAYWWYQNKNKGQVTVPSKSEGKPNASTTTTTAETPAPATETPTPTQTTPTPTPVIIELTAKEKEDLMYQATLVCEAEADSQGMERGISQYVETCRPNIYEQLYNEALAKKRSASTTNAIGSNFN